MVVDNDVILYSGENRLYNGSYIEIDRQCEIKQFSSSFGFHNEESKQDSQDEVMVNESDKDDK